MDEEKRSLKGSITRDIFKRAHKDLPRSFYATDIDFALVSKNPMGIVAFLDYKIPWDDITFAEAIAYNVLLAIAPVFIIVGDNPSKGPFIVKRYLDGDSKPEPPVIDWYEKTCHFENWNEFKEWEKELRRIYRKSKGWKSDFEIWMEWIFDGFIP